MARVPKPRPKRERQVPIIHRGRKTVPVNQKPGQERSLTSFVKTTVNEGEVASYCGFGNRPEFREFTMSLWVLPHYMNAFSDHSVTRSRQEYVLGALRSCQEDAQLMAAVTLNTSPVDLYPVESNGNHSPKRLVLAILQMYQGIRKTLSGETNYSQEAQDAVEARFEDFSGKTPPHIQVDTCVITKLGPFPDWGESPLEAFNRCFLLLCYVNGLVRIPNTWLGRSSRNVWNTRCEYHVLETPNWMRGLIPQRPAPDMPLHYYPPQDVSIVLSIAEIQMMIKARGDGNVGGRLSPNQAFSVMRTKPQTPNPGVTVIRSSRGARVKRIISEAQLIRHHPPALISPRPDKPLSNSTKRSLNLILRGRESQTPTEDDEYREGDPDISSDGNNAPACTEDGPIDNNETALPTFPEPSGSIQSNQKYVADDDRNWPQNPVTTSNILDNDGDRLADENDGASKQLPGPSNEIIELSDDDDFSSPAPKQEPNEFSFLGPVSDPFREITINWALDSHVPWARELKQLLENHGMLTTLTTTKRVKIRFADTVEEVRDRIRKAFGMEDLKAQIKTLLVVPARIEMTGDEWNKAHAALWEGGSEAAAIRMTLRKRAEDEELYEI
ncbi:unnamed protein product [Periconia digitata]|uniref:Uncharacterized protein n=1 Tax=Periconia digitata TaxID=1303443 RepID=A0A9W4U8A4_9PLEO|nr:unnamed protein product [Periconia digitata]